MRRGAIGLGLAGAIAVAVSAAPGARFAGPAAEAQGGPGVAAATPPCEIDRVERIVAVGDVHGAYDRFVEILKTAGMLDGRLRWTGGRAHLVQLGDVVDRGPDSRKALDLLQRLEGDAAKAGGAVHALLGNHEVLRMLGDVRYAVPEEYQAFVTRQSEDLRQTVAASVSPELRETVQKLPLGSIEMLAAFGPNGHYGEWLRTRDTAVKINGVLFLHGGISPATAHLSCDALNTAVRREITADIENTRSASADVLSTSEDGPLWYRGLAQQPEEFASTVDDILAKQNARAIVIGHTLTPDSRITPRFGGKVVQIDTGMQAAYVKTGRASALEIRNGVFTAIYTDRRDALFTLPADTQKRAATSR